MATTATLTAPTTTDNNNRSSDDNLAVLTSRKATHRRLTSSSSSTSTPMEITEMKTSIDLEPNESYNKNNTLTRPSGTFRIPKLGRPNATDGISSTSTESSINPPVFNRQTSEELNGQQGKRKFSLSQYKERKRLKSDELQQTAGDTDMRIHPVVPIKTSPPTPTDDEPTAVISPKSDEMSKEIVMKSNLSEPGVRKTVKKKLIWADEKNQALVQTSFFEVDDSELSEMHLFARTCSGNIPIAQLEKVLERDFRQRRGLQDTNDTDEKQLAIPLPSLIKILLPDTIQIPTIVSQERFLQEEREKTVLQALFLPAFLPDSPGEPDGDLLLTSNTERIEPKLIPLEDNTSSPAPSKITPSTTTTTGNSIINASLVSTVTPSTTTTTVTPSLSSMSLDNLSPEVAHILAQAKGNLSSANVNPPSSTSLPSTLTNLNPTSISTVANLPAPPNFLPTFFNVSLPTNNEPTGVPPSNPLASLLPNLGINFNLPPPPPPPTHFPLNQFLANAFSSLALPPPTGSPTLFPTATPQNTSNNFNSPSSVNLPSPVPPPTVNNNNNNGNTNNIKPPSVRFVSAMGQQIRPNLNNSNDSPSRENSREHHFRRGQPNHHHHHHHHRRDFFANRSQQQQQQQQNNNNNNNNRNRFS